MRCAPSLVRDALRIRHACVEGDRMKLWVLQCNSARLSQAGAGIPNGTSLSGGGEKCADLRYKVRV